jgi:hypothetical protein
LKPPSSARAGRREPPAISPRRTRREPATSSAAEVAGWVERSEPHHSRLVGKYPRVEPAQGVGLDG